MELTLKIVEERFVHVNKYASVRMVDGNETIYSTVDENLYRAIKMMQRDHIRMGKDLAKCEQIKDIQISKLKSISDILDGTRIKTLEV